MNDDFRPTRRHPSPGPDDSGCAAVRPLLTREELSGAERGELERHLGRCETCRQLRDQHRAVWSLLASASGPPPGPPDAEFLSAVHARCLTSTGGRWRSRRLAAAAALLLVALAGFLWFLSGPDDRAIIENLTVLEDLQAVQLGNDLEFTEVGRELLSLLEEEAEAADADELLELIEGSAPNRKG